MSEDRIPPNLFDHIPPNEEFSPIVNDPPPTESRGNRGNANTGTRRRASRDIPQGPDVRRTPTVFAARRGVGEWLAQYRVRNHGRPDTVLYDFNRPIPRNQNTSEGEANVRPANNDSEFKVLRSQLEKAFRGNRGNANTGTRRRVSRDIPQGPDVRRTPTVFAARRGVGEWLAQYRVRNHGRPDTVLYDFNRPIPRNQNTYEGDANVRPANNDSEFKILRTQLEKTLLKNELLQKENAELKQNLDDCETKLLKKNEETDKLGEQLDEILDSNAKLRHELEVLKGQK
uniref:Uncharacterized protein n=1 Tax=Panagrolaimus sp. JU765 TaxID=591449 RepID=A0AC34Q7Z8_9BILA